MDPAKNRLIDKIQRIEKIYNKNLKRIFKLIEKYNKGNRHIIRVQEILTIIDGYNSNDLLIKETGPYINKFEQPILDEKIQFLYEYNYEKYIIEGTQEQTEELIRHMINLIRDSQALKAYGYPSTYVPNIINQFVIISRKNPAS